MATAFSSERPPSVAPDLEHILLALKTIIPEGQVTELRALNVPSGNGFRPIHSGYFDDHAKLASEAAKLSKMGAEGVYFIPNVVKRDLLARANNRTRIAKPGESTSESGILQRRYLLIDCDPIRDSGISSTDEEHAAAIVRTHSIAQALAADGWPEPLFADSGNGGHVLYPIDLPAKDGGLVKRCLEALAFRFSDEHVVVDQKCSDANRIWKLYGTVARKGDSIPRRPHRVARLLSVPTAQEVVSRELLEELAASLPQPERQSQRVSSSYDGPAFDLEEWIAKHNLDVWDRTDWEKGHKWVFRVCPWNNEHTDRSAYIVQFTDGAIAAGCHHNGCQGKTWADLRALYDKPTHNRAEPQDRPRLHVLPSPDSVAPPPADGASFNLTEMGNAERLVARYGDKLLYCYNWKRWLVWDGRRWADDEGGKVAKWAKATVRGIYGEAEHEEEDARRKVIVAHAQRSESDKAVRAMISLAQPDRPTTPAELDSDATTWLLNCHNGTVDLRTGRLMPHNPDLRITKLAPTDYGLDAPCPTFLSFVNRIMDGNQELVTFLQRAIGYSLTGDTSEQVLFVPWGAGSNGKSTLLEAIAGALGDYATRTPPETFMVKRGESVPNDVARLRGARFVAAVESEEGQRLAESLVKQMTGGDTITSRFMRGEWFDFRPTFKLWLATNHKPVIRGTDNAIWRRIRLIPFAVTIPDKEKDKQLAKKLQAEASGILAWAVRGCLDWQREGLTTPAVVMEATEEYRAESDILGDFLEERCIEERKAWVTAKELYGAYGEWCEQTGERNPLSQRAFSLRISGRGHQRERSNGKHIWRGIGLRSTDSDPSDPSDPKNRVSPHEEEIREVILDPGSLGSLTTLHQNVRQPVACRRGCGGMLQPHPESGYYPCDNSMCPSHQQQVS